MMMSSNSGKYLSIRMVNSDSFSLGKDLAYTPGAVVFENDFFQLLQYEATTENVYQTPILIVHHLSINIMCWIYATKLIGELVTSARSYGLFNVLA